ncbi:MAG: hypothetical protein HY674_16230 [Chloroflexi bacterium]|nr:hypothetical protein [Chloroflexota bacterium]
MKTSFLFRSAMCALCGLAAANLAQAETAWPDVQSPVPLEPLVAAADLLTPPPAPPEPPALPEPPPVPDWPLLAQAAAAADPFNEAALAYGQASGQASGQAYGQAYGQAMSGLPDDLWFGPSSLSRRAAKSLVIRSSVLDEKAADGLEEDLNVMARILDKTLDQKSGDRAILKAMGIAIHSWPQPSTIRNLYLEGYGAVFMLNVAFPLLPPPAKAEETKTKEPANSTWEEAKRELYGPRGQGMGFGKTMKKVEIRTEEYDAKKVENLKEKLLEALKNATHIRQVKPDEQITLVVLGGPAAPRGGVSTSRSHSVTTTLKTSNENEIEVWKTDVDAGEGSIMTMRVKKSDVDAYAKDKIDLDAFKKKAAIAIY